METIKKKLSGVIQLSRYQEHLGHTVIISSFAALASQRTLDYKTAMILFANILSITYAFMINDVSDVDEDSKDEVKRSRNPVSSGVLSKRIAVVVTLFTASSALLLYTIGDVQVAILGGSSLLFGTLYSLKKVRLKRYPIVDVVSHGLFHAAFPFLAIYSLGDKGITLESILPLSGLFLLSVASDLRNELRDEKLDRLSGFKNTVSIIGRDVAQFLMTFMKIVCPLLLISYVFFSFSFEAKLALLTYAVLLIPLVMIYKKTKRILLGNNQEWFHFLNGSMMLLSLYIFPQFILFS